MINYCYSKGIRRNGTTTTVTFGYVERDGNIIYSAAITHPKDEFVKKIGRNIVAGRLETHFCDPYKKVPMAGLTVIKPEGTNLYGVKKLIIDDFNMRNFTNIYCYID